jgi:hypothetical protein
MIINQSTYLTKLEEKKPPDPHTFTTSNKKRI